MAIDTAQKRQSISGIPLPLAPGVTPGAGLSWQQWRQSAGWGYSGILAEDPAAESQEHPTLVEILNKRGASSVGHDSLWHLELSGATIIEPTAFEPDPVTHRQSHYYSAIANVLYRKVITRKSPEGLPLAAYWQRVSD